METLRSLRQVNGRTRTPGGARRAPVTTAVRVLATSGVLISALALAGASAAEAASVPSHASGAKHCRVTSAKPARPGPWAYSIPVTAVGMFAHPSGSRAVGVRRNPWCPISALGPAPVEPSRERPISFMPWPVTRIGHAAIKSLG